MKARQKLLEELRSTQCRCGGEKQEKLTFCVSCYRRLPKEVRDALYKPFGQGYEEAHARAVEILGQQ